VTVTELGVLEVLLTSSELLVLAVDQVVAAPRRYLNMSSPNHACSALPARLGAFEALST